MKKHTCLFLSIIIFFFMFNIVKAQSIPGYSITPSYPENQVSTTKGYFDIKSNANEKQTLKMRITNNKNEDISIRITSANSYTEPVGGITYSQNILSSDTSLLKDNIHMIKYISAPSNIIVKPNSTLDVPIIVTTPNIKSGTLLGGIIFTIKDKTVSKSATVKNKANFAINTATAYVFAIQINLPNIKIPELTFGDAGFLPNKLAAYIQLKNDTFAISKKISGTYKVTNRKGIELFSGKFAPFSMAPKTQIRFPIKWDSQTLKSDTYNLSFLGTENGKNFSTQKTFTIQNKQVSQAQEKNNLPQIKVQNSIPIWLWIILALAVVIIIYLLVKKKNTQRDHCAADDIKKYKELLDEDIITQEEYDERKKQLLKKK